MKKYKITECGNCPCVWTSSMENFYARCQLGNFDLSRDSNDLIEYYPKQCPLLKGDVVLTKDSEEDE
jgi:hypothetical protein